MSDWLELELAEKLRPAAAPEELWQRIGRARREPGTARRRIFLRMAPALFALSAVAAAATWFVARVPAIDMEQMAAAELHQSELAELRSSDAGEVTRWLAHKAGVQISIPESPRVCITGARVVERNRVRLGEVFYRVGGNEAALLVARAIGASVKTAAVHGHRSWTSHGQAYALASTNLADDQLACLLCHAALENRFASMPGS